MSVRDIEPIEAPATTLGEGPMWSARDGVLYWIDIVAKRLLRRDTSGRVTTRELPYAPGALFPRAGGGLLLVTKKGLALMDSFEGEVKSVPVPLVDFTAEIFNDGKCDASGRLWIGTRDIHGKDPKGCLYRIDPDLSMTRHATGFVVSNGMAFSPDGRILYHVDTGPPALIYRYDFDQAAGTVSNRRVFLDYRTIGKARPDGCTVDAQGGLWVAELDVGRIARYTPDGRLDRVIDMPIKRPTSVMFGGLDFGTLYITSMRFGLSEKDLADQPLAGALLTVDAGVNGLPEPEFGGGIASLN
jgi:sugar lactone lactonase YvrE